jgi:predicted RNase H-like HicB family nuclease
MGHKPWDMPWRRAERRRAKQHWLSEAADEVRLLPDLLDGGWVAERTDLPGCISQGNTVGEALDNLADAAEAWHAAAP